MQTVIFSKTDGYKMKGRVHLLADVCGTDIILLIFKPSTSHTVCCMIYAASLHSFHIWCTHAAQQARK